MLACTWISCRTVTETFMLPMLSAVFRSSKHLWCVEVLSEDNVCLEAAKVMRELSGGPAQCKGIFCRVRGPVVSTSCKLCHADHTICSPEMQAKGAPPIESHFWNDVLNLTSQQLVHQSATWINVLFKAMLLPDSQLLLDGRLGP